jgi:alkaline phosphatase
MTRKLAMAAAGLFLLGILGCGMFKSSTNFKYEMEKPTSTSLGFYPASSSTASYPDVVGTDVRNVIFMIGDGMGESQVQLARLSGVGPEGRLYMERMPVKGLVHTTEIGGDVTDSAAAGTALASGVKTKNGKIGVSPDGTAYQTILEASKAKGKATGLVVTSTISHATPACFASHVRSRGDETEIAKQMLTNRVNVLFGGGRDYFLPVLGGGKRLDGKNLIDEAKAAGYDYVEKGGELQPAQGPSVLGLFQKDALSTNPPEPTLAEMTSKAIEILSRDPEGFFMMVEGSQIDWACHGHDEKNCVRQTLRFDEAVRAAMEYALKDKRTLVIVTADHETGGMTLEGVEAPGTVKVKWSTGGHTSTPVPIYAFGPGAQNFSGVYENTEVPTRIAKLLKISPFPRRLD